MADGEQQAFICGQLDQNTFERMPDFDPPMSEQDRKNYIDFFNLQMKTYKWQASGPRGCHDTKLLNIVAAITLTERAYIQYLASNSAWESNLNQANQMLARCTSDYFGKPNGGKCQSLEEQNIAYKIKWKTATPQ